MKKSKILLSSLVLAAATLAGCGETKEAGFFGFGGVATYELKAATATAAGSVTTEINYASVLLGKDEKIKDLRIDVVQIKVAPNEDATATVITGKTKNSEGQDTRSKWELLKEYNMVNASPIKQEWYQQAESFEKFAVGKTVEELYALEAEDHYLDAESKVAAGVTVHVNGFMAAIERAMTNKVALDDIKDIKIAVGGVGSQAALQSDYTIAGAAFDKDHKVVAARMDVYQVPYTITAATDTLKAAAVVNTAKGQVVASDLSIKSKHDLKDAYGMATAAQGNWYVQANKITAFMLGKTVESALAYDETSKQMIAAAEAAVSIKVAEYAAAFKEAEHTAFNSRIVEEKK